MALARLGLDDAPVSSAPVNVFFPQVAQLSVFSLPPSEPYIAELHRCWPDPQALSHHTSNSRARATMANADTWLHGLVRLAPIEHSIVSLVVSPDNQGYYSAAALGPSAGLWMTSLPGVTTWLPMWGILEIRFLTSFWLFSTDPQ